jgi:AcrR family transcriptional regulator
VARPQNVRSTRDRILKAADRLFAEHGFGRTSLRALTREAGVNLAAVNYHFGSKLELLHGALSRHVEAINAERLLRLEKLEANPRSLSLEAVLDALYRPAFEFTNASARNAREIQGMLALLFREPPELVRPLLGALFHDVTERYLAALARLVPELPRELLELRYQLGVGAMIHLLADRGPELPVRDSREYADQLVAFVAAALRGPR